MNAGLQLGWSRRRWWLALVSIFALSVVVRGVMLWEVQNDPVYRVLGHDEGVNHEVAKAILAGTMPNVSYYKAPLYMYLLAGIYKVFGQDPGRARWVQVFLFSLTPILLAATGRRMFGSLVGVLTGLIAAMSWSLAFYSTELVDTSLAGMFYVLPGYLMLILPEGRWYKWLICGLALGVGIVTRPNIMAAAPLIAMLIVIVGVRRGWGESAEVISAATRWYRRLRTPALHVAVFLVGCVAAVSPVTLHNRLVAGEWVPIATYGGLNWYVANSPWADGKNGALLVADGVSSIAAQDMTNLWSRMDLNYSIAQTYAEEHMGRKLKAGEASDFFYRLTMKYIWAHPRDFLIDVSKRFLWFFNGYEFPNLKDPYRLRAYSKVLSVLSHMHFGVLCPLAVFGLVVWAFRRDGPEGMVYYLAIIAALFLGGLLFIMNFRYRLPTIYLMLPFIPYGAVQFLALWRSATQWMACCGATLLLGGLVAFSNVDWFGYSKCHHSELLFTYAHAALKTQRKDLLADAANRFERAYWDEMAHGGRPWMCVLYHSKPLTWMFAFFHGIDDREKMLKYGELMSQNEAISPVTMTYYRVLVKEGLQPQALKMLNALERTQRSSVPGTVAQALLEYYNRFNDPDVLARAVALMEEIVRKNPENVELRDGLVKYSGVLKMLRSSVGDTQASTAPASRPAGSVPTSGPGH